MTVIAMSRTEIDRIKWNTDGRRPKGADGLPAPLKLLAPRRQGDRAKTIVKSADSSLS